MTMFDLHRTPFAPHNRLILPAALRLVQDRSKSKPERRLISQLPVASSSSSAQSKHHEEAIEQEEEDKTDFCSRIRAENDDSAEEEPGMQQRRQQVFRWRQTRRTPVTSWAEEQDQENDDEFDSLWTLKRANPVYDVDDDGSEGGDELRTLYSSPSKRMRVQKVHWKDQIQDQIDEEEEPLLLLDSDGILSGSSIF